MIAHREYFHTTINYLKSPYVFIPSDEALNIGERSSHLQKLLWRKQDSNLQPQGYEPFELPIAPFRSLKYVICTSYSANIGLFYRYISVYQLFNAEVSLKITYLRYQLRHKTTIFTSILYIIGINSSKKNRQKVWV